MQTSHTSRTSTLSGSILAHFICCSSTNILNSALFEIVPWNTTRMEPELTQSVLMSVMSWCLHIVGSPLASKDKVYLLTVQLYTLCNSPFSWLSWSSKGSLVEELSATSVLSNRHQSALQLKCREWGRCCWSNCLLFHCCHLWWNLP